MNPAADVGVCVVCDEVFRVSVVANADRSYETFELREPPRGAWYEETGFGRRIGATVRHPVAIFLLPFTCVWSGLSMGGIYGSQFVRGEFLLLPSLLGIPFLVGTLFLIWMTALTLFGKVEVSIDRDEGRVFHGVGPLGRTRPFDRRSIRTVENDYPQDRNSGNGGAPIALVGKTRIQVGGGLSDARHRYLLQGLRKLLVPHVR
jgi:hypothetical protein